MTTSAAVAVIGGGVIGASIAYHLARSGVDDVVIIDRAPGPVPAAPGGQLADFAASLQQR